MNQVMTDEQLDEMLQLAPKIVNSMYAQMGGYMGRSDIEHEVLYGIWKAYTTYDGRVKPSTWVWHKATTTVRDAIRKEQRQLRKDQLPILVGDEKKFFSRRQEYLAVKRRRLAYLKDKVCDLCGSTKNLKVVTKVKVKNVWGLSDEKRDAILEDATVRCHSCNRRKL